MKYVECIWLWHCWTGLRWDSNFREAARCAREGRINMGKIKCNVNFSRRDGGGIRGRQSSFGSHRKSKYCALITYLPHGTSWQDLKDFCRPEADVILSKVIKPDTGKVYFATNSDLRSVVNRLDRKRLRSHLNDTGTVRVRIASPSLSRSYSRSRSRSRSPERRRYRRDKTRSRTCSRSVSYSKSRSKSLSPDSEYSRSRSRSRNSK
ncbi:MAG: Serine/arginine-rich splicing factor 1 [Marteilia pararefringens]